MPYGLIKVDNITFTNAGSDQTISVSGLLASTSGNLTVTGTVSGNTIKGQTISGVTVTGTTANFTSGNFTSISGGTYTITSGVFAPGSAANPSISFTSYPNTGFYRPGANEIAISTNGTGRLFVDASGNVGIGASPSVPLTVKADSNAFGTDIIGRAADNTSIIRFKTSDNTTALGSIGQYGTTMNINSIGAGPIAFYTNDSERARIDSSGRLGLGTSSPSYPASIVYSNVAGGIAETGLYLKNSQTGNSTQIQLDGNRNWSLLAAGSFGAPAGGFNIVDNTAGNTRFTIDSSGNVGIGTTSPDTALDVVGVIRSKAAGGEGGQITLTDVSNTEVFNVDVDNAGIIRLFSTVSNKDIQFGQLVGTGCNINFYTGQLERARIDSSGRLLVGTSSITLGSPQAIIEKSTSDLDILRVQCGALETSSNLAGIAFGHGPSGSRPKVAIASVATGSFGRGSLAFFIDQVGDNNSVSSTDEVARIDSSGRVGIGTTSPGAALQVAGSSTVSSQANVAAKVGAAVTSDLLLGSLNGNSPFVASEGAYPLLFITNANERARIDSSGRLLVGTSSNRTGAALQIEGTTFGTSLGTITNNSANSAPAYFQLIKSRGTSVGSQALVSNGDGLGNVQFVGTDGTQQLVAAAIEGIVDGTPGANDMPGRLVFSTTADGASSPTERARITSDGFLRVGKSSADINVQGISLAPFGTAAFSRDAEIPLFVNRNTDDGALVVFRQEGTDEGSISVSGTTVSYNGAHLSRWSQLPGGAERTEILRGTVLSNIDEMCGWGEEANEQLNRMKVSDVEGDPNVAGVFQAWDDDDDTYTDDFYCAMTGDFIIRVAEGVTVQRGDLLMSAGDGTAKPQDDDIVRSKTIAKVTSTHVTCTYDDGSYCVPCVLMAC
jgi:hypothetical protein